MSINSRTGQTQYEPRYKTEEARARNIPARTSTH